MRLTLRASALSTGGVAAHPDINSSHFYGSVVQRQRQQIQNLFSASSNLATPTKALSWILVVKLPPARKRYVALVGNAI